MNNNPQSGNVLFLILIAVALFAALSYAVTSSTRSGGGSADREITQLTASEIVAFFSGVRTSVLRMVLSGVPLSDITFERTDSSTAGVFSPNGGGAIYGKIPAELGLTEWGFTSLQETSGGIYVQDIGTNEDVSGREMLGGLANIPLSLCEAINKRLGLGSPPATNSPTNNLFTSTYSVGNNVIDAYPGQSQGCFHSDDGAGAYVYYITILEQ